MYIYFELRYASIVKPYTSLEYDSTTMEIHSYIKSQGFIILESSRGYATHYNSMFLKQKEEDINNINIFKVSYIQSLQGEFEYLFNFSNDNFRGHRIPVITQYNNKKTQDQFFGKKVNIFQPNYKQLGFPLALSDIIGVEVVHDASKTQLTYFFCLKQGVYKAQSDEQISFSVSDFTQVNIQTTGCQSIIKQNYQSVLINQRITCTPTECTDWGEKLNINLILEISGTIRQPTYFINISNKQKQNYSWTNNLPINYIFDFMKLGQYVLYVLSDVKNQKVLINLRQGIDDSPIFEGELNGITSLDNKSILYNTNALYVYETSKKKNASIQPFCLDSTYDSSLELCNKTTPDYCLFESNLKCLKCKTDYFLDQNGSCIKCDSKCNGCIDAKVCIACKMNFRDPLNTCQCITGRVESSGQCVCPQDTYEKPITFECIKCSTFSQFCQNCNPSGCTNCIGRSYIDNFQCIECMQNCLTCSKDECKSCTYSYYINSQKQCSSCNLLVNNCEDCEISGCKKCKAGYYLQNQQCIQCSSVCKNGCIDAKTCVECYTDNRDRSQLCSCKGQRQDLSDADYPGTGKCECAQNKFWDPTEGSEGLCVLCSQKFGSYCSQCNQDEGCKSCPQGYFVKSKLCVVCNSSYNNCSTCNSSNCLKCSDGYFLNSNNICEKCHDNCKNGCTTQTTCNDCLTDFRDKNKTCECIEGRIDQGNNICVCNDDRYESNGKCIECSSKFNLPCLKCSETECLVCAPGSYINENKKCECPLNAFFSLQDKRCQNCTTKFPQECKMCTQDLCLDCGAANSEYISDKKICTCKQGFYIESRINSTFVCAECNTKYGEKCSSCDENTCLTCSSGYSYNPDTQSCYCPTGSAVVNGQCKSCTFHNAFCSECTETMCTLCNQVDRDPNQQCKCSSLNGVVVEYNQYCYSCSIQMQPDQGAALSTVYSLETKCNFQPCPSSQGKCLDGKFEIYLFPLYNQKNDQDEDQDEKDRFLLSDTGSLQNFILPHGKYDIISEFTEKEGTIKLKISKTVTISKVFSNMEDLFQQLFSFRKSTNLKLEQKNILKYLAEILEIKQMQNDFAPQQNDVCDIISQNGSVCTCKKSDQFFLDCSGPNESYMEFQLQMVQYSKYLNDQNHTLTILQQNQFKKLIPLVNELVDSDFISKDNRQVDILLDMINESINSLKDVNNLPTDFENQANQLAGQISGVIGATSVTQSSSQKAMEMVTYIQKAALQTINPFQQQTQKAPPVQEIKTNNLRLDQKLIQCPTNKFSPEQIEFVIGDLNNVSGRGKNKKSNKVKNNTNNEENKQNINSNTDYDTKPPQRFLKYNEEEQYEQNMLKQRNKVHLQIRLLEKSDCKVKQPSNSIDESQFYNGVSASVYKSNPYNKMYELPYKDQQYEFFTTEYKYFDSKNNSNEKDDNSEGGNRLLQNNTEKLVNENSIQNNQEQLYTLNFQVISNNPLDNSQNFNNTLFKCIYLNETSFSDMKWQSCKDKSFNAETRQLTCKCPVKSTYVYDYDNIFLDTIEEMFNEIKKQSKILIIILIVMVAVFFVLIIIYAFIYNPKHIYDEIDQNGKQQDITDQNQAKLNNQNLYHVKFRESQNQNLGEDAKKYSNNKQSSSGTPINGQTQRQLVHPHSPFSQNLTLFHNNNHNQTNIFNNSNNKIVQNLNPKFDIYANSSSSQLKKELIKENSDNNISNNYSSEQNPSIFQAMNKYQNKNRGEGIPQSERKELLQTVENIYTERIMADQTPRIDLRNDESINLNTIKTNQIIQTNKELISNAKFYFSNSDENIDLNSKSSIAYQKSNSKQNIKNKNNKKNLKMVEEDTS